MKTLILKTEGMSAYGLQTFDVNRKVNYFPTRSSIVGILSAAMGLCRDQHAKIYALSQNVKIAVQVNCAGKKIIDYHTVQNFRSPHGKIQKGQTKPTFREYWCDSEHTFAITSDDKQIGNLIESVKSPVFTLFQGRKSCPLTRPLYETVVENDNPVNALLSLSKRGQVFSDVTGESRIASVQIRDLTTKQARKYAMRYVYVCGVNDENKGDE